MCFAHGHNTMMPVRLEPAAPRSRVKHSTTEPLCSLNHQTETAKSKLEMLVMMLRLQ